MGLLAVVSCMSQTAYHSSCYTIHSSCNSQFLQNSTRIRHPIIAYLPGPGMRCLMWGKSFICLCHWCAVSAHMLQGVNTLRLSQNGCHFPDNICKCIFLNENVWILIKNSLKFVPKGQINNIPALVQIMAWRRSGDKPLSEPMMV